MLTEHEIYRNCLWKSPDEIEDFFKANGMEERKDYLVWVFLYLGYVSVFGGPPKVMATVTIRPTLSFLLSLYRLCRAGWKIDYATSAILGLSIQGNGRGGPTFIDNWISIEELTERFRKKITEVK